ncbi:MAG TPA: type II pantothenate kinase [Candidatus Methanofastidiosa archaeon]|nr:type II pantothenate kinase [Candidatus Methanofastidiosa archaeon]
MVEDRMIIVGIDIGGTTTDAVAMRDGTIMSIVSVTAGDSVTAAAGALGRLVEELKMSLSDVNEIAVTGVGSNGLGNKLLGVPVVKVDEFTSIGTGGSFLTGIRRAIVISMGTGTAFVKVDGEEISHWGGTGMGGGTLLGLSKSMINISNIKTLTKKAEEGDLNKVDLTVGEIVGGPINGLPEHVTASNFGNISDEANDADKALALINLVLQSIGVMAVFSARANSIPDVVLTGKLTRIPQAYDIINGVGKLFGANFYIPENADYSTAIGAAIHVYKKGL